MATIRSREILEKYWAKGKYPTGAQAAETWASFWHKEDEHIPIHRIENLPETLRAKYDRDEGEVLENRMNDAEGRLDDHDTRFDRVYERLDDAEEQLDEHTVELGLHNSRISVCEMRLDLHASSLADHEARIGKNESDIGVLKLWNLEQDGRLDGHDKTLAEHAGRIATAEGRLDGHDATLGAHASRLTSAEGRLDDHDGRISANKSATEKNAADITDLQNADQQLSQRISSATSRISDLEKTTGEHSTDISGLQGDVTKLYQTDAGFLERFAELTAQIQALQIEGKILPLKMNVRSPETITLRNTVPQKITAELLPDYVTQNVLFLGDDRAVSVDPATGDITVNAKGESVIHVLPTENVALAQKKTIKVVNPSALIDADGSVLLDVDYKIFLT